MFGRLLDISYINGFSKTTEINLGFFLIPANLHKEMQRERRGVNMTTNFSVLFRTNVHFLPLKCPVGGIFLIFIQNVI